MLIFIIAFSFFSTFPRQLRWIMIDADKNKPTVAEASIAAMTAENRTTWADAREEFFSLGLNHQSLRKIETALFVLSLDDENPGMYARFFVTLSPSSQLNSPLVLCFNRPRVDRHGKVSLPWKRHQPVVRQIIHHRGLPQCKERIECRTLLG